MPSRPRRYDVVLTNGAEQDLEGIYDYIAEFDSPANAESVLIRLMDVIAGLEKFPDRGGHPKELAALGIREYRQATFKSYRLIYRVLSNQVVIYLIADGRRDMQSLLARRLLGA